MERIVEGTLHAHNPWLAIVSIYTFVGAAGDTNIINPQQMNFIEESLRPQDYTSNDYIDPFQTLFYAARKNKDWEWLASLKVTKTLKGNRTIESKVLPMPGNTLVFWAARLNEQNLVSNVQSDVGLVRLSFSAQHDLENFLDARANPTLHHKNLTGDAVGQTYVLGDITHPVFGLVGRIRQVADPTNKGKTPWCLRFTSSPNPNDQIGYEQAALPDLVIRQWQPINSPTTLNIPKAGDVVNWMARDGLTEAMTPDLRVKFYDFLCQTFQNYFEVERPLQRAAVPAVGSGLPVAAYASPAGGAPVYVAPANAAIQTGYLTPAAAGAIAGPNTSRILSTKPGTLLTVLDLGTNTSQSISPTALFMGTATGGFGPLHRVLEDGALLTVEEWKAKRLSTPSPVAAGAPALTQAPAYTAAPAAAAGNLFAAALAAKSAPAPVAAPPPPPEEEAPPPPPEEAPPPPADETGWRTNKKPNDRIWSKVDLLSAIERGEISPGHSVFHKIATGNAWVLVSVQFPDLAALVAAPNPTAAAVKSPSTVSMPATAATQPPVATPAPTFSSEVTNGPSGLLTSIPGTAALPETVAMLVESIAPGWKEAPESDTKQKFNTLANWILDTASAATPPPAGLTPDQIILLAAEASNLGDYKFQA
jgi:hypothetical protein